MKAASLKEIKDELKSKSPDELLNICLHFSKFKKENKELLTYLLFEANNENDYIEEVKHEIKIQFESLNQSTYYLVKKSVRKVLRNCKKYIRYSKKPQTEIEILIYFCSQLIELSGQHYKNTTLITIYSKQLEMVRKKIKTLHEDLQYDYNLMLEELEE
tara:strand:- start:206 stop:682 length:477 start_codon:yes stop_codon:yes gene_type:complete